MARLDSARTLEPMIEANPIAITIKPHPPTEGVGTAPITAFDAVEVAPEPTELVAVTVNVYGVPLVSPITIAEVS